MTQPQPTEETLGTVVSLWRYPVKSMQGEELNAAEVGERGVLGDRAYAVLDRTDGKVASAKNPRKWPRMFEFRAGFADPVHRGELTPPVRITLPDGTVLTSDQPDVDKSLSHVLDREVTLEAAERLPKDSGILRTAARHNELNVGVYGSVLQGGEIHRGDPIRLE